MFLCFAFFASLDISSLYYPTQDLEEPHAGAVAKSHLGSLSGRSSSRLEFSLLFYMEQLDLAVGSSGSRRRSVLRHCENVFGHRTHRGRKAPSSKSLVPNILAISSVAVDVSVSSPALWLPLSLASFSRFPHHFPFGRLSQLR